MSPSVTKVLGYTVEEISLHESLEHHDAIVERPNCEGFSRRVGAGSIRPQRQIHIPNRGDRATSQRRVHSLGRDYHYLLRANDSSPIGILGISHDITQRKRMEDALRASEERFRELTENASDWVWEVNADGAYTYASPKIRDMLGYEPHEVIGKTPFYLMPREERKRVAKVFRDAVEAQKPYHNG